MRTLLSALIVVIASATAVAAAEISFEEIGAANRNCCYLGEEYAALGIHFFTTDDGSIWDGMSNGDPGGWGLEGTNGPSFLAFNGASYSLTAEFDLPTSGVSLDVAASAGAGPGSEFTLEGWLAGTLVETVTVPLGAMNQWMTVALTEEVDELRWFGTGSGFHPFGVDNLQWGGEPATLAVAIDVMPGNDQNPVHPLSQGVVKVVVFGSPDFDAGNTDETMLLLGSAPVDGSHTVQFRDVNDDGHLDAVSHHAVPEMGVAFGDTEICLTGLTLDGQSFEGCDGILTVPSSGELKALKAKGSKRP